MHAMINSHRFHSPKAKYNKYTFQELKNALHYIKFIVAHKQYHQNFQNVKNYQLIYYKCFFCNLASNVNQWHAAKLM